MSILELPSFRDLLELPEAFVLENLISIPSGGESAKISKQFLRIIAQAVISKSSDIYFNSRHGRTVVNIETGRTMLRYLFEGKDTAIRSRLTSMCGLPEGVAYSDLIKGRFSMQFPPDWAAAQGLTPLYNEETGKYLNYLIDFRVQLQKTVDGWSAVVRLFDDQTTSNIDEMNLPGSVVALIKKTIASRAGGIISVTGPTCSGKSTTLHAILVLLNDGVTPIFTISDPHERTLRGDGPITHWEVTPQHTALDGLHAALRSRPRIIMIGEIRTEAEMDVALQAAATGQIVLTTWHSNDSIEGITRAVDLTIDKSRDAYRVAELVKLVISQRLIPSFKPSNEISGISTARRDWLKENGINQNSLILPTDEYQYSLPIVECLKVDLSVKRLIKAQRIDQEHLFNAVKDQDQFETLAQCAWRYIEQGRIQIDDAIQWAGTQLMASESETLRAKLVREFNTSFTIVNEAVDIWQIERYTQEHAHVETVLEQMLSSGQRYA